MEMDFGSEENASIVYAALAVDKEVTVLMFYQLFSTSFYIIMCFLQLQPDKVKRGMSVSDGKLSV